MSINYALSRIAASRTPWLSGPAGKLEWPTRRGPLQPPGELSRSAAAVVLKRRHQPKRTARCRLDQSRQTTNLHRSQRPTLPALQRPPRPTGHTTLPSLTSAAPPATTTMTMQMQAPKHTRFETPPRAKSPSSTCRPQRAAQSPSLLITEPVEPTQIVNPRPNRSPRPTSMIHLMSASPRQFPPYAALDVRVSKRTTSAPTAA